MFLSYIGLGVVLVGLCLMMNMLKRRRALPSSGKAVLITGCDHGFGSMLAVHLSTLGYQVFAGCLDAYGHGATKLRETSSNIVVVQLDVTSDQQMADAREYVETYVQGLWAVVNNAGVAAFAEAEWCSLSQYQTMMNVNWLGTVRTTKAFLPLIRAAGGRIINVASLAGRVAIPGFTAYSSSKFAVVAFSDSLRREMVKFGVKVITVEPSLYRTALSDSNTLTRQNQHMWSQASQEVRRYYGDVYFRSYVDKLSRLLRHASSRTHEVVEDLVHAVSAVYPYTRYVPGLWSNQLPTDAFSISPNHFQDVVLGGIFTVPALPAVTTNFSMQKIRKKGV